MGENYNGNNLQFTRSLMQAGTFYNANLIQEFSSYNSNSSLPTIKQLNKYQSMYDLGLFDLAQPLM